MKLALLALAAAAGVAPALAYNYTVGVGMDETTGLAGIGFDPSRSVVGTNGDLIVFRFLGGDHRVLLSDFGAPCSPNGAFDTGLQTVANGTLEDAGPTFIYTVTDITKPLYFYDGAGDNCRQGAVFLDVEHDLLAIQCRRGGAHEHAGPDQCFPYLSLHVGCLELICHLYPDG
ncbi:hypothetical protein RQP46_009823 [Phenoliferia psychrophenolica]